MKISNLCQHRIVTIDTSESIASAAQLMLEHHVGALVVTRPTPEGPRVCGVVTDRDMVIDALAMPSNDDEPSIGALAHATLVLIKDDADSSEAILAMQQSGVRRLLVTNDADQLTGILSLDDLIQAYADDMSNLSRVISGGITREKLNHRSATRAVQPLQIPAISSATAWARVAV